MNEPRAGAFVLAGRLMRYPDTRYADDLRAFADVVSTLGLDPAPDLAAWIGRIEGGTLEQLQELYTQTFDMTPACTLDVGWHVFGEDYERGAFLVEMRERLRARGIPEGGELPDHLSSMLTLLASLDVEQAAALSERALVPAVDRILAQLATDQNPFEPVIRAVRRLLPAPEPAFTEVSRA